MSEHVEEQERQPTWAERNADKLTSFPAVVVGISIMFGMMLLLSVFL